MKAAQDRQWVRVMYQSPERLSTQHLLPLMLSSQNAFWYCQAYAYEHGEERMYRVDRIQALEPPGEGFQPGELVEQRPYSDPSHPEVIVKLTAQGAAYVESEPDIGRLVRRNEDGSSEIAFRCPPSELPYFARYFAGLGADGEVIAPEELRQMLAQIGKKLVEQYRKR